MTKRQILQKNGIEQIDKQDHFFEAIEKSMDEYAKWWRDVSESDSVAIDECSEALKYEREQKELLIEALDGIKNCSDCGSETAAIMVMKRIAIEATTKYKQQVK